MNNKENIIAIGPHPDDIEIGCGGTLLNLRKRYNIHFLIMTDGGAGGADRKEEQTKSAEILGAEKIWWGKYKDTHLPLSREVIKFVENILNKVDPVLIFTNYTKDTHQDHRILANNMQSATRYRRDVLYYEVPTSIDFNPTVFMDIGKSWEHKKELLKAHSSQIDAMRVEGLSILESARACAIFRGYQGRVKYAEGFVPLRYSLDWGLNLDKNIG
ncbi:MAG: PIG-L family deacetylase [Elusimicrobia bacterium]|jgi:LmbE family N-acetylglucosaminyl deacetylase|nr:PIG-L family deacetylase [Elusimicrobiota bacterium]